MTINIADNSPRVSYAVAEGATQSSFTVSFEFFDNDDLNVYVDGTLKTLTTDYTVTGGDGSTGTITMSVTGAVGGSTVVITRDIDLERTTDFPASGAFNIATLNTELDRMIAIAADLDDRAARALQLTDYDAAAGLTLPELDDRKGTVLAFNSSTGAVEAGPTTTNVNQLADITDDIATLADIEDGTDATDAIQTVAGISSNVTTVAGISSNVTTVAGITANIATVAGDSADIVTVAGDSADIQALADLTTEIGLLGVADVISDMNTLATSAIVTDMDALANLTTELDALGDITANITTVAGISSNVTTVAGDSADIGTLAGISSNISTVAGISSNVTTVATNDANITTVATNISGVNSFAERYRVSAADPTTSLDAGDLAFVTDDSAFKYYDGTSWNTVGASIANVVEDATPQLGGDLDTNGNEISFADGSASTNRLKFGTGDDFYLYHNGSHAILDNNTGQFQVNTATDFTVKTANAKLAIKATANDDVVLYNNTIEKLATTTTGIDVSGWVDVDDGIRHNGDSDTFISFGSNSIQIQLGGTQEASLSTSGFFLNDSGLHEDYDALSGASPAPDVESAGYFSLTMSANTTFTFGSTVSGYGAGFVIEVTNGSTAYDLTWPSSVKWAGGTTPDAPAASETDIYVFFTRDGGTNWYGARAIDAAS